MENKFSQIKSEGVKKMKICMECEHFNSTIRQCKLCGCFMPVKVLLPNMTCPDNPPKW